jgi:DNA integrity scanning protein DisA with diadenylate cyclase activity
MLVAGPSVFVFGSLTVMDRYPLTILQKNLLWLVENTSLDFSVAHKAVNLVFSLFLHMKARRAIKRIIYHVLASSIIHSLFSIFCFFVEKIRRVLSQATAIKYHARREECMQESLANGWTALSSVLGVVVA